MNSVEFRTTLRLLVVMGFVTILGLIAIAMVLYFRGQWMQQTDAITKELAAGCAQVREMLIENRESVSDIRRQMAEEKVNQ